MSRSSRRRRSNPSPRVVSTNTNRRLRKVVRIRRLSSRPTLGRLGFSRSVLRTLEDRREFHPERARRPARGFFIPRHRLVILSDPVGDSMRDMSQSVPFSIGFERPKQVAVCIRRKQRREVIHALGKAGAGVRRRRPRRSEYSDVRC